MSSNIKCLKKLAGSFKEDNNVYVWEMNVYTCTQFELPNMF